MSFERGLLSIGGVLRSTGAAFTGSQESIDQGRNRLTAAAVVLKDLGNQASYSHQSMTLGAGVDFGGQSQTDEVESGGSGSEGELGTNQHGQITAGHSQVHGSNLSSLGCLAATIPVVTSGGGKLHSTISNVISDAQRAIKITNLALHQKLTGQTAEETIAGINGKVTSSGDYSNYLEPLLTAKKKCKIEADLLLEHQTREVDSKKAKAERPEARTDDFRNSLTYDERQKHRTEARELRGQAQEIEKKSEIGGSRQIAMDASGLTADSSAGAGMGQLFKATIINLIQCHGGQLVKQVVDKIDSEPARLAMHAILSGVGPAAQRGDLASDTTGASVSVLLNNLMEAVYDQGASSLNGVPSEKG